MRLVRLVGYARAIEWLAAGRVFAASEALQAGLVNRAVARGEAIAEALNLAQDFAANDASTVRAVKRITRAASQLPPAEAMRIERETFPDLWAAPAHLKASAAFVARRNHHPRPA